MFDEETGKYLFNRLSISREPVPQNKDTPEQIMKTNWRNYQQSAAQLGLLEPEDLIPSSSGNCECGVNLQ